MKQGQPSGHGAVDSSRDTHQQAHHISLEHNHRQQVGFQAPVTLTTKRLPFVSGSVSPRKETRGRKRRTRLSQMLVGESVSGAASCAASVALGAPHLQPLSAQLHMQWQTKADPMLGAQGGHGDRGAQAASVPAVAGPLLQESPLGLTLKKTPSLLDLISSTLGSRPSDIWRGYVDAPLDTTPAFPRPLRSPAPFPCFGPSLGMASMGGGGSPADKLKASNFAAVSAKIGTWERHSRYEGDLVAKCYFAKKKLVWEVLDAGLKSKIEVQWVDIRRIKALCSDTEPNVLEIDISKAPMFFHEMSPQPRKHTIWSNAPDFTGGQATVARKHVLTFPPGVLEPHYKKLLLCDSRLRALAAGLPEPVAMRPPLYHKMHVPRPAAGAPFALAPSHPLSSASPVGVPVSGLVDTLQRVLLQERPGSPSSVIGRGDRSFGEESGSSEDTAQLLSPPGLGFVDGPFARLSAGTTDADAMLVDTPMFAPPMGLFSDLPYDLAPGGLLVDADMEPGDDSEGLDRRRAKEAGDQLSSSHPLGGSVFSEGGRLRKSGFASSVPSLGSEMSAFHVVRAGPKALRSEYGKSPPHPSPLEHFVDGQLGDQEKQPDDGLPAGILVRGSLPTEVCPWRGEEQGMSVQY